VTATPVEPSLNERFFLFPADAPTDDQGGFRFSNLEARKYQLRCNEGELKDALGNVIVTGGQNKPVTLRAALYPWSRLKK